MKKVCFYLRTPFSLGGEQRVTTVLANYLAKAGYSVYFLVYDFNLSVDYEYYKLDKAVETVYIREAYELKNRILRRIPLEIRKRQKTRKIMKTLSGQKWITMTKRDARLLADYINRYDFDYVIGIANDHIAHLTIAKPFIKKAKIIGWQHSTFEAYFKMPGNRMYNYHELAQYMFDNVDRYVVQTESDAEKIRSEFNANCTVINNPNTFEEAVVSTLDNNRFISVGRFVENKRFMLRLKAFRIFSQEHEEWKLYLVGDGVEKEKYLNYIEREGMRERVILTGSTNETEKYYAESDIYLMTSRWEGWGMTVVEAMQHGLPVISVDLPSIREIFGDSNCGIILESDSREEMVKYMKRLAENREKMKTMGRNAVNRVKAFDREIIGKKWEAVL